MQWLAGDAPSSPRTGEGDRDTDDLMCLNEAIVPVDVELLLGS